MQNKMIFSVYHYIYSVMIVGNCMAKNRKDIPKQFAVIISVSISKHIKSGIAWLTIVRGYLK